MAIRKKYQNDTFNDTRTPKYMSFENFKENYEAHEKERFKESDLVLKEIKENLVCLGKIQNTQNTTERNKTMISQEDVIKAVQQPNHRNLEELSSEEKDEVWSMITKLYSIFSPSSAKDDIHTPLEALYLVRNIDAVLKEKLALYRQDKKQEAEALAA